MLLKSLHPNKLFLLLSLSLICSCATQEEIERRKNLQRLIGEMQGQQSITKSLILKLSNIENSLGIVSGKIEESTYSTEQESEEESEKLSKEMDLIKEKLQLSEGKNKKLETNVRELNQKINEQKKYLQKVLSEIQKITSTPKKHKSLFDESIYLYQRKNYPVAKQKFLQILDQKKKNKLTTEMEARIIHNLGMINYIQKDYKNSQIYFSKLFTNFSQNPLNSSGLFHLGSSFKKQKNIDAAKETWQLLIKTYPRSKYSKKAKKIMGKM